VFISRANLHASCCKLQIEQAKRNLDVFGLCTDTWSKRTAQHGAPLCNAMVLLPGSGAVFGDVVNLEGDVMTGKMSLVRCGPNFQVWKEIAFKI